MVFILCHAPKLPELRRGLGREGLASLEGPRIMERVHWVNMSRLSFPEPWLIPLLYSRIP